MIDFANKQYATVLEGVAGEALEQGQGVKIVADADGTGIKFLKAAASADFDVQGTLFAYWINERSTTVNYSGGEDGLTFPLAASTDLDAAHFIPSGARMIGVGGKGVAEIRFFVESLNDDFASTLPAVGTVLGLSSTDAKLCATDAVDVISGLEKVARVTAKDEVSVTVILG